MNDLDLQLEEGLDSGRCRSCGCTERDPCPGGCSWVDFGLCSRCDESARTRYALTGNPAFLDHVAPRRVA